MKEKLKCIVVDDESLARKLVVENIRQIPFLECVATCKNPFEAMEVLRQTSIDLMFLDIQMPGMLGTKFLASLRAQPMVIFITAYANYAVESYELEVVDYLMKPVSIERFSKAAYKALDIWQKNKAAPTPTIVPPTAAAPTTSLGSFFVNVEYALVKIIIQDITHIEGMKDYVKIYLTTAPKPILTKATLKSMQEKLPTQHFMRVHKSFVLHLNKIEMIRNRKVMIGTHEIPVSEGNYEALCKKIVV